jgi:nucleoside-diphosphate-sugar epimerase
MATKTVLVAGATGVSGLATLEHFAALGDWNVLAVSRRRPDLAPGRWRHLALDLTDAAACRAAAPEFAGVTHLVYAALFEKPGLAAGWRERDQMETNLAMLRNLMEPLAAAASGLRHVSLLQGGKAYGMHLHPIPLPAKERWPRDPHENFYWLQDDYVREAAAGADWNWTIFRPQVIFGGATGAAMNLIPVLGAYAAIRREEGRPFSYPGGASSICEAVDARLLARAFAWAAEAQAARNETFNLTNGDVFVWRDLWPGLARVLGVEAGPDESFSLADYLAGRAEVWAAIVAREGLCPVPLPDLLGQSHHYADILFAHGRPTPRQPLLVSTVKIRQAGFADCVDTEDMFRDWFAIMAERRILPWPMKALP